MADRLNDAASPYLLQHADNPVDWWPWCDAAFEEAARRDVPVFLSIGYATCHWCHVMAHESFEDTQVAALLNQDFVCIKVDREERPDIDAAYMAVCQAMTGRGGWPLTAILSPDRTAFFAGTYFPKTSRGNMIGMLDLVPGIAKAWNERREELLHEATHLHEHLERVSSKPPTRLDPRWPATAMERLRGRFDARHGGFGSAPKFPSAHQLRFLLRHGEADTGLEMVQKTLAAIYRGGIHDHVGGGVHRYSTDRQWLVPHFEKMLYDQAMLMLATSETWCIDKDPRWLHMVETTAAYLFRNLQHPDGAFYSAEDADSEGEEGRFYVWSQDEVERVLGDAAPGFIADYGVQADGNFRDEATGGPSSMNILHRAEGSTDRHEAGLRLLLDARSGRIRPLRDEKVMADWNGLIIAALSHAGARMDLPRLVLEAERAASFVWAHLHPGRLRHRWFQGRVDDRAFLDDHAFLAWGLLELSQATQDPKWLRRAVQVADEMLQLRGEDGRLRLVLGQDVPTPVAAYDGAIPSGNSVAVDVLARLGRLMGRTDLEAAAQDLAEAWSGHIDVAPEAYTAMLRSISGLEGQEVIVAGTGPDADAMVAAVRRRVGDDVLVVKADERWDEVLPWTREHPIPAEGAKAYVCKDHACDAPVDSARALSKLLGD